MATLGASNLTYAEARLTQQLPDWIEAHIHALEWFGGVAKRLGESREMGVGLALVGGNRRHRLLLTKADGVTPKSALNCLERCAESA